MIKRLGANVLFIVCAVACLTQSGVMVTAYVATVRQLGVIVARGMAESAVEKKVLFEKNCCKSGMPRV